MKKPAPGTRRYRVVAEVTISMSVVVHAGDEQKARELADKAPMQRLCSCCSHGEDDEWSTSGEFDGTPQVTEVREEEP